MESIPSFTVFQILTLPPRNFFHAFLCGPLIIPKINFFEKLFKETDRVSNSLDPDQAWCFLSPDVGPNCLQRLLAYDTIR